MTMGPCLCILRACLSVSLPVQKDLCLSVSLPVDKDLFSVNFCSLCSFLYLCCNLSVFLNSTFTFMLFLYNSGYVNVSD